MAIMNSISEHIQGMDQEKAHDNFKSIAGKSDYSSTIQKINYLIFSRNFYGAFKYSQAVLDSVPVENIKIGVFINLLRAFYFSGRSDCVQEFLIKKLDFSNDKDKLMILSSVVELGHQDVSDLIKIANVKINERSKFILDRAPLTNSCDALKGRDGKFLFVSGTPRSGTSAFGVLLNYSDEVALSVERYGYAQGYHPFMFNPENLFYTKEYEKKYKSIREKLDKAIYVGDKRPNFLFSWEVTKKHFPPEKIRIIHFIRDPYLVAESYRKRAEKQAAGKDAWSPNAIAPRDEFYACHDLNLNNKLCLDLLNDESYRDSILVVNSENFYQKLSNVEKVFDWLGLEFDEKIKKSSEMMLDKSKKIKSSSILSKEVAIEVDRYLDFRAHENILNYSFC